jgi:hypothetical protein
MVAKSGYQKPDELGATAAAKRPYVRVLELVGWGGAFARK